MNLNVMHIAAIERKRNLKQSWAVPAGIMAMAVLLPMAAHAGPTVPTAVQGILCQLAGVATGTTGKAMASVAIIAVGISAMVGKVSWNLAGIVLVGIALLFGSGSMIGSLGGSNTCTAGTSFTFSCSGGTPTGNMFSTDVMTNYTADTANYGSPTGAQDAFNTDCAAGGTNPGIFATILCFFKAVVGEILSSMYCQFQQVMVGPMSTAMTLFTLLFGFMIVTGITNFTAKEATLFLLKMAIVWTFALNPAWGIGIGYQFFMGVAEEGAALVTQGSTAQITDPDSMITSLLGFISGNGAGNLTDNVYNSTSGTGMSSYCIVYATAAFVALLLAMPLVAGGIIMLILQFLGLYFRAALGYLTAMVLISFLFVLAPLFIGFALFKTTMPLFEQWVKFLISFSVQMIIVFGFLTMISYVPVGAFFNTMMGLLKTYDNTGGVADFAMPVHACSLCEYTITTGSPETIACNAASAIKASNDDVNATAPDTGYVIPLTALGHHLDFARFAVSQALAFYLIFWVIQDFMKRVPEFARSIGGLSAAPPLAGGDFAGMGIDSLQDKLMGFVGNHDGLMRGLGAAGAMGAGAAALLGGRGAGASSGSGSSSGNGGSGPTVPRPTLGAGPAAPSRPSGPAGNGKMNVDAAVAKIDQTPGTYGRCAHSVREALEAGGVNTSGHEEYARDYDPLLVREGFKDVSGSDYVPKKGDVVVIHATDGGGAGHIAMYDGTQWVSDHKQRHMLDGLHVTSYKIYRANGTGSGAPASGAPATPSLAAAYAAHPGAPGAPASPATATPGGTTPAAAGSTTPASAPAGAAPLAAAAGRSVGTPASAAVPTSAPSGAPAPGAAPGAATPATPPATGSDDDIKGRAIAHTLRIEGGFSNDAADHGGATNHGITLNTLRRVQPNATVQDVRNLTKEQAAAIYDKLYYKANKIDEMPAEARDVAFDSTVNHGRGAALIQQALNRQLRAQGKAEVAVTNHISEADIAAMKGVDGAKLRSDILAERNAYYHQLVHNDPSQARFLHGWMNRLDELAPGAGHETAVAEADLPAGGGGGGGGTGGGGGGGGSGSTGGGGGAGGLDLPAGGGESGVVLSEAGADVTTQGGFHLYGANTYQATHSGWDTGTPAADEAKQKADEKAAAEKKAADDAAAAAATAAAAPAPAISDTFLALQNNTLSAVKALEMQVSASRSHLPEAVIAQAESTISAAYSALSTDSTEDGLSRALNQVQMAHRSLV